MTANERWKLLRLLRERYQEADRNEKKRILDDVQSLTGLHRKSLIRRLNGELKRKRRKRSEVAPMGPPYR